MRKYFRNVKVIGDNIDSRVYLRQEPGIGRGNPALVVSRSMLADFVICPHRWLNGGDEDEETKSLRHGNIIDCAVLTPEQFDKKFVIAPATYVGANGEEKDWNYNATYCKDWRAEQESQGLTAIKQDEFDEIQLAVKNMEENSLAMDILKDSKKQVMLIGEYVDEQTGLVIPVKALLDFVPSATGKFWNQLGDFKSTQSAAPEDFEKSIFNYNYDMQAWLSMMLWNEATGEKRDMWQFLIQENTHPFETPVQHPSICLGDDIDEESSSFMAIGKAKVLYALKRYAKCLKHNIWPSYGPDYRFTIGNHSYIAEPREWMASVVVKGMESVSIRSQLASVDKPTEDKNGDITP